jgi:two-component system nitrate/nitrite response regulator NarL
MASSTSTFVPFLMPSTTPLSDSAISPDRRLRILVAEDHPVVRESVRRLLTSHPRFEICGEAHDGAEAIDVAQRLKPDVVVMNITMPVKNGIEAAREIKAKMPELAIVILSSHADRQFVELAKKSGARAYVAKSKAGQALLRAIEAAVTDGDFVLVD